MCHSPAAWQRPARFAGARLLAHTLALALRRRTRRAQWPLRGGPAARPGPLSNASCWSGLLDPGPADRRGHGAHGHACLAVAEARWRSWGKSVVRRVGIRSLKLPSPKKGTRQRIVGSITLCPMALR
jgi:hypothetical protein